MRYRVLVPLDGSTDSECALQYTQMLAGKTDISLELLRCFEPPATVYALPDLDQADEGMGEHSLQGKMRSYLERKKAELEGVDCDILVHCGDAACEILARAKSADFVVIARHGRGGAGRWLLGGVTTKVARSSSRPVLVVPGDRLNGFKLDTIMVCLDGSTIAEKGLQTAAEIARAVGAKLLLYRFVHLLASADPEGDMLEARSYLQALREYHSDVVSEILVQPGTIRSQIAQNAEELGVDLVVLGSHGRQGFVRWLLGSVAEHALHHVGCPVMIVHQDP